MKGKISIMMGTILGFIVSQMGGWSEGLAALVLFMGIDYASGLVVAGVFHQSKKAKMGHWNHGLDGKVYAKRL